MRNDLHNYQMCNLFVAIIIFIETNFADIAAFIFPTLAQRLLYYILTA
jgi:hypothetical protein